MKQDGKGGKGGKGGKARSGRLTARVAAGLARARTAFRRGCLPAVAAILLASPTAAHAQTDPRLVAAVRQAQEGRGDSARIAVQRLLAATPISDSLYPQIVYTQAMVANSAQDMRRHLQRIAVEFPTSSWADDALLRLVQLDYATGNLTGAARNLERLRLDYPLSPLMPQAAYWAGQTYFDLKNTASACRWLDEGLERAGSELEIRNQLQYLRQRCQGVAREPGADTARPGAAAPSGPPVARAPADTKPAARGRPAPAAEQPARSPAFRVQVAAVSTQAAAEAAAADVRALGLPVVTVREGGLYKVRAGAFATRAEAQAAAVRIKARLGGSPFPVAEQ